MVGSAHVVGLLGHVGLGHLEVVLAQHQPELVQAGHVLLRQTKSWDSRIIVGTLTSSCILYAVLRDPDPDSIVRGKGSGSGSFPFLIKGVEGTEIMLAK